MQLDEEQAQQLGVNVEKYKIILLAAATLIHRRQRILRRDDRFCGYYHPARRPPDMGRRPPVPFTVKHPDRRGFYDWRRPTVTYNTGAQRNTHWGYYGYLRRAFLLVSLKETQESNI